MKRLYQKLFKEGNGDQRYLRCPYVRDNNFEVLFSEIALYQVDLECAETFKSNSTVNGSVFITYSNTINFSGEWLDKSGCLITQWQYSMKNRLSHGSKKLGISKKMINVGKISDKDDILTVEEKITLIGNKTKRSL